MTLLRAYLAVSLDGYIADCDRGVSWLDPFFSDELDFKAFFSTIGVSVMGRRTFDHSLTLGVPETGMRSVVLTHRPIEDPPAGFETFAGDVRELAQTLRRDLEPSGKDVWLMGGGASLQPFVEAGLVDRWELSWIPILLGTGVPLFPPGSPTTSPLRPIHTRTYKNGIVEVHYERG